MSSGSKVIPACDACGHALEGCPSGMCTGHYEEAWCADPCKAKDPELGCTCAELIMLRFQVKKQAEILELISDHDSNLVDYVMNTIRENGGAENETAPANPAP